MAQPIHTICVSPRWESMRRLLALALTAIFLVSAIPPTFVAAQSEIEIQKEERREEGSESPPPEAEDTERSQERERREVRIKREIGNPMAEIFKDTFFGALTGLLIGGILVASDSDHDDVGRKLSTSAAIGAGVGLLYGAYVVASLESQTAALEWDGERFALNAPRVGARLLSAGQGGNPHLALETSLLKVRF